MIVDYESQKRWCGSCAKAVVPVDLDGRPNCCPECHYDTMGKPRNPGMDGREFARRDATRA